MNHGHRCLFTCLGWYHTTSNFNGFHSHYCQPRLTICLAPIHQACGRVHSHYEHASFFGSNWGREERGWIGRMFHLLVCCNKGESPIMIIVTPTLKSWGSKVEDLIVFGGTCHHFITSITSNHLLWPSACRPINLVMPVFQLRYM